MDENGAVEVGVVGCGAIAQLVHLPILSSIEDVTVSAVCDGDIAKAGVVAERFGVKSVHRSVEELLASHDLGAVIVCTPNHVHAEHSEAALRAGAHVLCERPLGTNHQQVSRLLRSAQEAGTSLMVANNHRFRPDAWTLRGFITRGELGKIFHMQASWLRRGARRPRVSEWRRRREHGGGVILDLGVTIFDLCLWLVDYPAPERLTAYLVDRDGDGVEDAASVLMKLEGDLSCSVDVSWDLAAREDRHTLFALGADGWGSISPFVVQRETGDGVEDVTPRMEPGTGNVYRASYRRELDYFLGVVRGKREEPLPTEQEILMRIVDACYRSAAEGCEIVL
jgi:predicted dehydrogenase